MKDKQILSNEELENVTGGGGCGSFEELLYKNIK